MEKLSEEFIVRLEEADDWEVGEGYLTALAPMIYETLLPFARRRREQSPNAKKRPGRPPRTTHSSTDHNLDQALDDLAAAQHAPSPSQRAIAKARRRAGRARAAVKRRQMRQLFKTNEKDCVRQILARASGTDDATGTTAQTCPIPNEQIESHFESVNTPRTHFDFDAAAGASFRDVLASFPAADEAADVLTADIEEDEIEDQLQRASASSSPGLDGISYAIFKRFRAELLPALHAAFSFCWRHRNLPSTWKVGAVRLLFKKGDPSQPSNWRPICLQSCFYKLYSGVLANRYTKWMDANERHSPSQKGFRSINGCSEHNFLSSMLLDQQRRRPKQLYMIWYDFQNAFGAIPPELIWRTMESIGVDRNFVSVCQNIYSDSFYTVTNTATGMTDPIQHRVGVYQGCPLSPQLFITGIIPLLRALEQLPDTGVPLATNERPAVAAYADDLKVFSDSKAGIKKLHTCVEQFLKWSTMRANPAKCAALALTKDSHGRPAADDLALHLDGEAVPLLDLHSSYQYLGVGDGFNHVQRRAEMAPKLLDMKKQTTALLRSGLAPWQVLRAIKTYVQPQATYLLQHTRPLLVQLKGYDRVLTKGLKHLLRLPKSTTSCFVFSPIDKGGLGFVPLHEQHALLQVSNAWLMLHSSDPMIRAVARAQVLQIIQKRFDYDYEYWREKTDELIQLFLNSELSDSAHARPRKRPGDIGSSWIDVQRHLRTYKLRLSQEEVDGEQRWLQLRLPRDAKPLHARNITHQLTCHMQQQHWSDWKALKDQGRSARVHGGPGSEFIKHGKDLWDQDYEFALRARLNQVPTRATLKRQSLRSNGQCRQRGCSRPETLAHVLNHCTTNMDAVTARHDAILSEIDKRVSARNKGASKTVKVNETVDGYTGPAFRPDIQLLDATKKTAAIVDLVVAFDDQGTDDPSSSNLRAAHDHKTTKYDPIKKELEHKGWKVYVGAIVYGSLGSVLPSNFNVFTTQLGLHKKETRMLERSASTKCIKASRRIWKLHTVQADERTSQPPCGQQPARERAQRAAPADARGNRVSSNSRRQVPANTDRPHSHPSRQSAAQPRTRASVPAPARGHNQRPPHTTGIARQRLSPTAERTQRRRRSPARAQRVAQQEDRRPSHYGPPRDQPAPAQIQRRTREPSRHNRRH
ncbi:reverse transcriptase [Globisporangium polare]